VIPQTLAAAVPVCYRQSGRDTGPPDVIQGIPNVQ
jgi:hypothetical protein